ncbi:MAG: hypothetical protein JW902_01905 [Syntrophaceae bacterium]|nr:hypothetical protein [Syntrophaceae bacterium]
MITAGQLEKEEKYPSPPDREAASLGLNYSLLVPESNPTEETAGPAVHFITIDPGSAACFVKLARLFLEKNTRVSIASAGEASKTIENLFPERQIRRSAPPAAAIIVSSETNKDLLVNAVREQLQKSPKAPLIVVEDSPNSVSDIISLLLESSISPAMILTATRAQADAYKEKYPSLTTIPIIPAGQPSFTIEAPNPRRKQHIREKLGALPDEKIIAFIGHPHSDRNLDLSEKNLGDFRYRDLNSFTLSKVLESLIYIAGKQSEKAFAFVYLPHPREEEGWWNHPIFYDFKPPSNLRIIAKERDGWREQGLLDASGNDPISSKNIGEAADVVITIGSTLATDLVMNGLNISVEDQPVPVGIALTEFVNALPEEQQGIIVNIMTGMPGVAHTAADINDILQDALFGSSIRNELKAKQLALKEAYRAKGPVAYREYLWIKNLLKHGQHLLDRFSKITKSNR